ncbi:hypothetical protein FIBSPDRAFT_848106 [Athelia psychrophila]|uniref:Uncharacterized protein n=1 Tax=Athelia psychrophila TaxID=1759441 RepID=A0A166VKG0_9AGAM|nr:hypothetical protein FIBSPDRAFT_848106 [Fibularhizoctonia sp. CBS 109695]
MLDLAPPAGPASSNDEGPPAHVSSTTGLAIRVPRPARCTAERLAYKPYNTSTIIIIGAVFLRFGFNSSSALSANLRAAQVWPKCAPSQIWRRACGGADMDALRLHDREEVGVVSESGQRVGLEKELNGGIHW